MQSYYYVKMKCVIVRIMTATFLLLCGLSILCAILSEMLDSFHQDSRVAYVLGSVLCVLLILYGIFMFYQSFHFERSVFGKNHKDMLPVKEKDQPDDMGSKPDDLVITDRFIMFFSMHFLHLCTMILAEDIIACFESPSLEMVENPKELTLTFYTKKFKTYSMTFTGKKVMEGHEAMLRIKELLPWIIDEEQEAFLDQIVSKGGRSNILHNCEKRRYQLEKQN